MSYLMNEFIKFTYLSATSQAQEEKTNTEEANPFRIQVEDLHIFFLYAQWKSNHAES